MSCCEAEGRNAEEKYELNSSVLPAGVVAVFPLCVIFEVDFPWWCKIALVVTPE
jgi:hypothetical protein